MNFKLVSFFTYIRIKDRRDRPAYSKLDYVIVEPISDYATFFSSYDNNLKYVHQSPFTGLPPGARAKPCTLRR